MRNEAATGGPGRYCALNGLPEDEDLQVGMDFRLPRYRREVFKRFYEFHLRYRSHPGAVYYVLPHLRDHYGWDRDTALWFAYINGNTQNPVTSWLIWSEFPRLQDTAGGRLERWFAEPTTYGRLVFDTDRRHHKKAFAEAVARYRADMDAAGGQEAFWGGLCAAADEEENFRRCWGRVLSGFHHFGRLSTFSYLEYLRILGLPVDCDQLFLEDMDGSKSHRNGLCKVLGRDDLDWHSSNPSFEGYSAPVLEWLKAEGAQLLGECRERFKGASFARDVSYFTLESTLCTYKGWHRENRRYANVYNDMFHDRIRKAEENWGDRFGLFWESRRAALPAHLRLEDNPLDEGVKPVKQNHYRTTGQVIMMDREWPCFKNAYNDARPPGGAPLESESGSVLDLL